MLRGRFQILEESRECISYVNSCSLSVNRKNEEQMRSAIFIYFVNKQYKMLFWVLDVTDKSGLSGP